MEVTLTPIKQIFFNPENDFRILSCIPNNWNNDVELSKYGNFTLSGTNINSLIIGQSVCLDISPDINSKYDASYIVNGYAGISYVGQIKVDPKHELLLLEQIMSADQAKNVNNAYPNFVEMVLNNQEAEIDIDKIYNVGDFRFTDYCNKIRENFGVFLFFAKTKPYNITDFEIVSKLFLAYNIPEIWEEEYRKHPYEVLNKHSKWSFNKIDNTIISALPEFLHSEERAKYCIYHYLEENETDGDTKIDARIIKEIIDEDYPELSNYVALIIKNDENIYYDNVTKFCGLKSTYEAELNIADNIKYRINHPMKDDMDWQSFKDITGFTMTEEQNKICQIANDNSIGMMIGAAGVGKTTATKALIKMLEHYAKSYILLAPTGIAAKRLRESTGRSASTIHMALARGDFQGSVYDYVIIDEMSCVGVKLLSSVFELIPKETKVIFICDNAQLASISCGNIVEDIINSNKMPIAELTKVFRYGSSGIATIATNTRKGNMDGRGDIVFEGNDYDYHDIDTDPLNQIVEEYSNLLLQGYNKNDILILCPYNKSTLGTYTINEAIQNAFNNSEKEVVINLRNRPVKQIHYKIGDRVINTQNNYKAVVADIDANGDYYATDRTNPIMNGDIGVIRDIRYGINNTFEIFIQFDESVIVFTHKEIKNLLLGYCITCHKSQGCESKAVISVIGKNHKRLVTRNLLYVAVSRAKEKLIEIVYKDCVESGINVVETMDRNTWLSNLMSEN